MFTSKYSSARPNRCFSSSTTHRNVSHHLTTAVRRYIDSPGGFSTTYVSSHQPCFIGRCTNHDDFLNIHGTVGHLGERNIIVLLHNVIVFSLCLLIGTSLLTCYTHHHRVLLTLYVCWVMKMCSGQETVSNAVLVVEGSTTFSGVRIQVWRKV